MQFPLLGELEDDTNGWWKSAPVAVPYFDGLELPFVLEDLVDVDADFVEAVGHFLALTSADRLAASQYVFKNYGDFRAAVGADSVVAIAGPDEVWRHVTPTEIYLSRRSRDNLVYLQIAAECDWEEEHGLQLVYRRGAVLNYVSAQDGHLTHSDAPEAEDKIC